MRTEATGFEVVAPDDDAYNMQVGDKGDRLVIYLRDETDRHAVQEIAPAEARALAALLLKHADRAEGRRS